MKNDIVRYCSGLIIFAIIKFILSSVAVADESFKNNDWDFSLAAGIRSFPIGAGVGGSAAFNHLLWGNKTKNSIAYGYLRPSVGVSTSGMVNKGGLKVELSPIAPLVLSSGYQLESTNTKLETIDCNVFGCNHSLRKNFLSASFVFGILPWFAKLEQVVENQKSSEVERPFADPDSSLVGLAGGEDRLVSLKVISGFLFGELWTGGLHFSRSKFQDSQSWNEISDIFIRKKQQDWNFVGGMGFYESTFTEKKAFMYILIEWHQGHSLGI